MAEGCPVVLIGLMGAGKTSVARALAEKTGWQYYDTDAVIVKSAGKSIEALFAISEAYFRSWEKTICTLLLNKKKAIISTGGGVASQPDLCRLLKKRGNIVYLYTEPAEIYSRIAHQTHRPLLQCDNKKSKIETLFKQRDPVYSQLCDQRIVVTGLTVDAISDILITTYGLF